MNTKQLYDYVLDQALAVGLQVSEADLTKPTPDTDWTVRDLIEHILTELVWLPDILAGKTIGQVGTAHDDALIGNDVNESLRAAIEAARQAVQKANLKATAHLSYADKSIGTYLLESADDILVHSWDLGQAIGVSVVFDESAAQQLYDHMSGMVGQAGGLFGSPVMVGPSASIQSKLLALLGRREDWAEQG